MVSCVYICLFMLYLLFAGCVLCLCVIVLIGDFVYFVAFDLLLFSL